ncbi:hypothetical protein ElyMa_002813500 [Elysia marginata]|uniref:Uncharacterized protein n=1 Tax=Elysia marginata TaxID=1093978 RepID=A0AAV4HQF8_9GAST|nr:hypothetical protein ElyMa_002813500 [Elysia marginata]
MSARSNRQQCDRDAGETSARPYRPANSDSMDFGRPTASQPTTTNNLKNSASNSPTITIQGLKHKLAYNGFKIFYSDFDIFALSEIHNCSECELKSTLSVGRESCKSLNISLDQLLYQDVNKVFDNLKPDTSLRIPVNS